SVPELEARAGSLQKISARESSTVASKRGGGGGTAGGNGEHRDGVARSVHGGKSCRAHVLRRSPWLRAPGTHLSVSEESGRIGCVRSGRIWLEHADERGTDYPRLGGDAGKRGRLPEGGAERASADEGRRVFF